MKEVPKCPTCGGDTALEKFEAVMAPGVPTLNLKTYKCQNQNCPAKKKNEPPSSST